MSKIEQQIEEIGLLRDQCDNLLAAASLPMPPDIHVQGLVHGLKDMRKKLSALYDEMEK